MENMQVKIRKIRNQIVKNYNPQKIILFGSFAFEKQNPNSDVDLLIIKETKKDHYKRIPEVRACLHNINQAFDILVMTPREIEKRLKLGDFFIEEIMKKGEVLYERK